MGRRRRRSCCSGALQPDSREPLATCTPRRRGGGTGTGGGVKIRRAVVRVDTPGQQHHRGPRRAPLPDLRFHDLRHTGAVLAASTGATLAEPRAHRRTDTTDAATETRGLAGLLSPR